MTITDRIERAARAMQELDWFVIEDTGRWQEVAQIILLAAEPELYADPPTHWRAPMEATEAMQEASNAMMADLDWQRMRDAHLKDAP